MKCRRYTSLGVGIVVGIVGGSTLVTSCDRRIPEPPAPPAARGAAARQDAAAAALPAGSVMLALSSSAYHASVIADGDVFTVLTATTAYRLEPNRAPVEMPLDLGFGATTTRSAIVFWSQGAVFAAPKAGGDARRLLALRERPQSFVASGNDIGWLVRSPSGRFSLHALAGDKPRAVYRSPGNIDALAMLDDWITFVERPARTDWRIGRVRITGGAPAFTPLRGGRQPAMLVARDGVVYYDGNHRQVRRLSPDLEHEETLASDIICSPLAVADRVYCARPEGIFAVAGAGAPPLRLAPGNIDKPIADLAASSRRLMWVSDAGADKLQVRSLPLDAAP